MKQAVVSQMYNPDILGDGFSCLALVLKHSCTSKKLGWNVGGLPGISAARTIHFNNQHKGTEIITAIEQAQSGT